MEEGVCYFVYSCEAAKYSVYANQFFNKDTGSHQEKQVKGSLSHKSKQEGEITNNEYRCCLAETLYLHISCFYFSQPLFLSQDFANI